MFNSLQKRSTNLNISKIKLIDFGDNGKQILVLGRHVRKRQEQHQTNTE